MKCAYLYLAGALAFGGGGLEAKANVVGYVNVGLTNNYNFVVNQLDVDGTNAVTKVLGTNMVDGTSVFLWDVTNQVFTAPSTFDGFAKAWNPANYFLTPGKGFVVWSPSTQAVTMVGNVLQGMLTNFVAGNNKFSLVGSIVPISDTLSNLFVPGGDGNNVVVFSAATQNYLDAFSYFGGFGWFDPKGVVSSGGPTINVGQSFFIQNLGPSTNWIRNFVVPSFIQQGVVNSSNSTPPTLGSLSISGAQVTLRILNPGGGTYTIEFSADGQNWSRVATGQTGNTWTGPCPGGGRGYYRLTTP